MLEPFFPSAVVKTIVAGTRLELEAAVAVFQADHVGEVLSISFSIPSATAHGHTIPGQFPARRAWVVYRPR